MAAATAFRLPGRQTRAAQMREQQTRTMAGLVYSICATLVVAAAVLMALPEFGFDVTPFEAAAAVGSLALGFGFGIEGRLSWNFCRA